VKKRCDGALVEIRQRDPVASHPPIERPNHWQLRSSRLSCISQRDEMLRERIQMWPQWAGARATYSRGCVAVICHFSSPFRHVSRTEEDTRLCRLRNNNLVVIRFLTVWVNERARHNPGLGMMTVMPLAA
jgi:hypothetical protein